MYLLPPLNAAKGILYSLCLNLPADFFLHSFSCGIQCLGFDCGELF